MSEPKIRTRLLAEDVNSRLSENGRSLRILVRKGYDGFFAAYRQFLSIV